MRTMTFPLLLFFMLSCEYKDFAVLQAEPPCIQENVISFSKQVYPVFLSKCAIPTCHNHANQSLPFLTQYNEIKPNIGDIVSQLSNNAMPPKQSPGGSLTTHEKALINCWIDQGGLDN